MKTISIAFLAVIIAGCSAGSTPTPKPNPVTTSVQATPDAGPLKADSPAPKKGKEIVLFDGASLKNWKKTEFGGEGEVTVENGLLVLDRGATLTGVTWTGPELPKTNYEVTLEAKLINGTDFFCGIGFPVGKSSASFVAGGWGGSVCGISSIDGEPAAENDTSTTHVFKENQWYQFCVHVRPEKIEVWLDDLQIVDAMIKDREVAIHPAMQASLPFGLTSFQTKAAYRNVKIRELD